MNNKSIRFSGEIAYSGNFPGFFLNGIVFKPFPQSRYFFNKS